MTTCNHRCFPARGPTKFPLVAQRESGILKPSEEHEVSVFDFQKEKFTFKDSFRKVRKGQQKLPPLSWYSEEDSILGLNQQGNLD